MNPATRIPQSLPATMIIKAGINAAVGALPCHLKEAEKGGVEVLLVASMVGAVSLSADVLHVPEKLFFLKSYFYRKATHSRKATLRQTQLASNSCVVFVCTCAFSHGVGATTRLWTSYFQKKRCLWRIPECHFSGTTLFEQSDFSRGVAAHSGLEKLPLFSKSHFLRKVTFLAALERAVSAKSHFSRKATFLDKLLFSRRWSARCPRKATFLFRKATFLESNFS